MPFGLYNAPATFQRLIDKILWPFINKFVVVYLDDITIYSKTFNEHCEHLQAVFNKLQEANLKLNIEKCFFFLNELKFLGHIIGKDRIKPDDEKIEKVKNFSIPTNIRQIRGFLGLASYYRKFIKEFSRIAKPLNLLLQKDQPYYWGDKQEKAFQTLKNHLITAPILQYPNFKQPFYVHTDASQSGLGAVLAQLDENKKEHAIVYASRSLNKAEQNYSATELECLAVI